ncbi:MAG: carotenoid oxygenase family protein [Acidimicrobiia bacterium]
MDRQISRRDLLRWSLLGGATVPMASLLAACDGGTSGPAAARRSRAGSGVGSTASNPSKKWWLQANFAPVTKEVEAFDLEVTKGAIPASLAGLYVRNGSNPQSGDSSHWFFGDGMVHGVRLEGGKAKWYRNRYVRTSLYDARAGFGDGPPGGASNQANVSAIWHGGTLLTSGEVGLPYELSADDLSTTGVYDFGGRLRTAFTAHPKIDPVTGELHFFGYGFTPPFLTYHVAAADGTLIHSSEVPVRASTMIHDFTITETDAVFWELPVVFDLESATKWIANPDSGVFPYRWSPDYGARIGIMPLGGPGGAISWYEIDQCYVFHGVNAHRDGHNVVLDVCRLSSMFEPGQRLGGDLTLRRWTVDTERNRVTDDVVERDDPGELPSRDPRRVGRSQRFGYFVQTRDNPHTVEFGGLIKRDYRTGRVEVWDPGPSHHAGEWLFVPDGGSPDEDAGYLLTYLHDDATNASELVIVDASDVTAGPVARIRTPQRVPYGFHATWVPA